MRADAADAVTFVGLGPGLAWRYMVKPGMKGLYGLGACMDVPALTSSLAGEPAGLMSVSGQGVPGLQALPVLQEVPELLGLPLLLGVPGLLGLELTSEEFGVLGRDSWYLSASSYFSTTCMIDNPLQTDRATEEGANAGE
jgi:hypothetical protein